MRQERLGQVNWRDLPTNPYRSGEGQYASSINTAGLSNSGQTRPSLLSGICVKYILPLENYMSLTSGDLGEVLIAEP